MSGSLAVAVAGRPWPQIGSITATGAHPLDGGKQAARNLHQQRPALHKAGDEVAQGGALQARRTASSNSDARNGFPSAAGKQAAGCRMQRREQAMQPSTTRDSSRNTQHPIPCTTACLEQARIVPGAARRVAARRQRLPVVDAHQLNARQPAAIDSSQCQRSAKVSLAAALTNGGGTRGQGNPHCSAPPVWTRIHHASHQPTHSLGHDTSHVLRGQDGQLIPPQRSRGGRHPLPQRGHLARTQVVLCLVQRHLRKCTSLGK